MIFFFWVEQLSALSALRARERLGRGGFSSPSERFNTDHAQRQDAASICSGMTISLFCNNRRIFVLEVQKRLASLNSTLKDPG